MSVGCCGNGDYRVIASEEKGIFVLCIKKFLLVDCSALFVAVGIFIIIARFDLAALRKKAPKELLIAFLLLALLCFVNLWRINYIDIGEPDKNNILTAIVFACWGIVLFRYYHDRGYLFEEQRNIQNIENMLLAIYFYMKRLVGLVNKELKNFILGVGLLKMIICLGLRSSLIKMVDCLLL